MSFAIPQPSRPSLTLPFPVLVERVLYETRSEPELDGLLKGRGHDVGHITTRKDGSKWRKDGPNKWVRVSKGKRGKKADDEEGKKGKKKGPSYIRKKRDAHGDWRYVYSEAGLAHKVSEGETIHLGGGKTIEIASIQQRGPHMFVEYLTEDGQKRSGSAASIHRMMHDAYGARYVAAAEKVAARWGRAAQKLENIASLKIDGEDGAFAKKVYAQLESVVSRTKSDSGWSASLTLFLTDRRKDHGWTSDGTLAVIKSLDWGKGEHAPMIAANIRQIIDAAENLAKGDGGSTVTGNHVAQALAMRWPDAKFTDKSFETHVLKIEGQLREENARMETALGILENATKDSAHAAAAVGAYVKGIVDLQSGPAMERLATAFPGLRRSESLDQYLKLSGRTKSVLDEASGNADPIGSDCKLFITDAGGHAKPLPARYKLVEAADLIASHNPTKGFSKNPAYPEGVQERRYHNKGQLKNNARENAQRFHPEIVHNTNADAINGPPMVTTDNVALGGNSRSMTQQLMYHNGKGDTIKSHLADNAHNFGLTRAAVDGMKQPILVREVVGVTASEQSGDALKLLVRQANESLTMGMDPRSMDVARAARVNDHVVQSLTAGMKPGETLNSFLSANRDSTKGFVQALESAGVLDKRNADVFLENAGERNQRLNADGRRMVGRMFVGRLVPDADMLGEIPEKLIGGIAMSAPSILAAAGHGDAHDMMGDLRIAIRSYVDNHYAHATGVHRHPPGDMESLKELTSRADGLFGTHPIADNKRAREIYRIFAEHPGENDMSQVFRSYLERAQGESSGAELFGGPKTEGHEHLQAAREGWAAIRKDRKAHKAHNARQKKQGKLQDEITALRGQIAAAKPGTPEHTKLSDERAGKVAEHAVLRRKSAEFMDKVKAGDVKMAGGYVITLRKGRKAMAGEVRHRADGDYKKTGDGHWEIVQGGAHQSTLFGGATKETDAQQAARVESAGHHIKEHARLTKDLAAHTGRYFRTRQSGGEEAAAHKQKMAATATAHDTNLIEMAKKLGLPPSAEHAKRWMKANAEHVGKVQATMSGTQQGLFGVPVPPKKKKYKSGAEKRKIAAAKAAKRQGSLF